MEPETPSSFLFADLKRSFGISNRDTARMVLTDRPILSGVSPRDRAEERTFLSREIVHAEPGYLPESFFRPFDQAAQAFHGKFRGAHVYDSQVFFLHICIRFMILTRVSQSLERSATILR